MEKNKIPLVEHIKEHGLAKTIDKFDLKCKVYENKILLKYDQLETSMDNIEAQNARGIILEKNTWKVMCYTFSRFFNAEESRAAKIDWSTAKVQIKIDGSLIQCYHDWYKDKWMVSTSGLAEAEGEINNLPNTTFESLFWKTAKANNFNINGLDKSLCYAFELTTPYNIVVTPHSESKITLLAARNLNTLEELHYNKLKKISEKINIDLVGYIDFNFDNVGQIKKTFENMPFSEEGYVVVDANFNRIKIKNPAYVAAHRLKSKTGNHHIMDVIKTNETDEFIATFKEREEEVLKLKVGYNLLLNKFENAWNDLIPFKPKNITKEETKKFAMAVFEISDKYGIKPFTSLFFSLKDNKIESIKDYITNMDNKKLYNFLIKS